VSIAIGGYKKMKNKIIKQIKEDLKNKDLTSLDELISALLRLKNNQEILRNYLNEEDI
jgi:hypothetical protein